jgi:malonate-semialdehyde dehydrogenase (acetylating)/methylmalonate-semialdehyde dehydrogenase
MREDASRSEGELRRGIENVEVATGIPSLMMGSNLEDIASGIDELMIRQPVGVVAVITPFNFPGMIPLWFLPYAVACGNTVILKPSEKTPLTMARVLQLTEQAGFPSGVINLVHGGKDAVDALLDHPEVRAISFVGSTPVARYIYSRAAANGKRVQCQGGAKNPIVVLPDADMDMTTRIVADSAFGCAGQRCLAPPSSSPSRTRRRRSRSRSATRPRRGRWATASTREPRWDPSSLPRAGRASRA